MYKKILIITILILSISGISRAQTINGEIRLRGEYRNGYRQPTDSSNNFAAFVSQRTRLGTSFNLKNVQMKVTFQDIRIWGNQKLKSYNPTTSIYEAWALLPLADSLSLKLGRQEIIYDNERILSNNNWNQAAQVHDAVVFKFLHKGWKFDLGGTFSAQQENLFGNNYSASFTDSSLAGNYKTLDFLVVEKQLNTKLKFNIIALADGFQKKGTENTIYTRGTLGGAIKYKPFEKYSFTVRGYQQTGKTSAGNNIDAWYINADAEAKINEIVKVNPGVEIMSGNDGREVTSTSHAFSTLYGTGHNFNGHMDYFTDIPKHTKNSGLIDAYVKTDLKISEKTSLKLNYHYFSLQNTYVYNDAAGKVIYEKSYLGSEIDLNCNIAFSKEVSLLFGYSMFMPKEPLNLISGGEAGKLSHWGFVMLTIKPGFTMTK